VNSAWLEVDLLTLIEELVEAHCDTIEVISDVRQHARDFDDHLEYLRSLTRTAYAVLARNAG
jgi:hypothetical protein